MICVVLVGLVLQSQAQGGLRGSVEGFGSESSASLGADAVNASVLTNSGEILWPLPEVNLGSAIDHVLHCYHDVYDGNEHGHGHGDEHGHGHGDEHGHGLGDEDVNRLAHRQHCAKLLQPVLAYMNETKLVVPDSVCQALFPEGRTYNISSAQFQLNLNRTFAGERSALTEVTKAWKWAPGSAGGNLYNPGFMNLAMDNLRALVWKEYSGTLNDAEQEYIESWLTPTVASQSAVALSCQFANKLPILSMHRYVCGR
jgi:hypothetical protein